MDFERDLIDKCKRAELRLFKLLILEKTERKILALKTALFLYKSVGNNLRNEQLHQNISSVFIGLILSTAHITTALNNAQLSTETKAIVIGVSLISSLLVGVFASLNLKKDV